MSIAVITEDTQRYERTWPAVGFSSLKEIFAPLPLRTRFVERTMRRSIEDVYTYVADLSHHDQFLPREQIRDWRVQTSPSWGHGTRVSFEGQLAPGGWRAFEATVISDVPLRMIALKLVSAPFEHSWAYTFAGKEGICKVRLYGGFDLKRRLPWLHFLTYRPMIRRLHTRALESLTRWAEREAAPT